MTAVNIHLTDKLRMRLELLAAESGFDSLQAYVEAMLRADAAGAPPVDDERLERLLLDRLDGPFVDVNEADFQQMRQELSRALSRAPRESLLTDAGSPS